MIAINYTTDSDRFTLNGKVYPRIFQAVAMGTTNIAIYNIFDTKYQLLPTTPFNEIQVNGTYHNSQEALIDILLPILYDKTEGGAGGSVDFSEIIQRIEGKEDKITKKTAFNKNFGTQTGTVAEGNDERILQGATAFGWGDHHQKYVGHDVLNHWENTDTTGLNEQLKQYYIRVAQDGGTIVNPLYIGNFIDGDSSGIIIRGIDITDGKVDKVKFDYIRMEDLPPLPVDERYYTTAQVDEKLSTIELTPGPQGPQGLTGEKGPKGDKGDPGEQGIQGIQGPKGDAGIQGPKGDKGEKGLAPAHQWVGTVLQFETPLGDFAPGSDLKGPKGDKGDQGIQGVKGEKGDAPAHTWNGTVLSFENPDGSTGLAMDLQGPKGDKGDKGNTGDRGIQGIQGPQGPKGDKPAHWWSESYLHFENPDGTPGVAIDLRGPQGPKGDTGNTGPQGPVPMHQWSGTSLRFTTSEGAWGSYVDLKGEQGIQGIQGPKGNTGSTGPKGDQGIQGIQGERGFAPAHQWSGTSLRFETPIGDYGPYVNLKGDKGDKGDRGLQGSTGPKGDKGDKGDEGPQGFPGIQGPKGDTGAQGPKGDKGDPGSDATVSEISTAEANSTSSSAVRGITGRRLNAWGVPKTGGTFTGNITAPKFYQSSLRSIKTNIKSYEDDALSLITGLNIVNYDYKTGGTNNIGVIADDTDESFLSNEKDAVNLYNTIFIQAKAIQQLTERLEALEKQLGKLK